MQALISRYIFILSISHITSTTVHGFRHTGIFTALGLLDDIELTDYGEMSADSNYELSDDQQSQGGCNSNLISDSEEDSSHEDQLVHTKLCLSVADVFTRS